MEKLRGLIVEYLQRKDYPTNSLDLIKGDRCPYQFVSPADPNADPSHAFDLVINAYLALLRAYPQDMTDFITDAFGKYMIISSRWTMEQCIGLIGSSINEAMGPGTYNIDQGFIEAYIDNVSIDPQSN